MHDTQVDDRLRPEATSLSNFRPVRTLTLEIDAEGIAVIRMNLPDRPMNVTTPELTADLMLAFEHVASNPRIKGAILTSGKDKCFVAGGDIKDFVNAYDRGMTREEAFALSDESSRFFRRIETCGKPVAAAINGLALGGGMELCLACHYRVIVDDPKAIVGQPEATIGLLPGGGGTQRLPRLIGIDAALPLLLSGQHVQPAEALRLGLVHAVVPAADLIATAKRWLLAHPDACQPWDIKGYAIPGGMLPPAPHLLPSSETLRNYPALPAILSCVFEGTQVPIDVGLRIESTYFSTLLTGAVARNLMRTTFVNKGLVNKLAHRPPEVPKADIKRLGIMGDGMAAARLAWAASHAGIDVMLRAMTPQGAEECRRSLLQLRDEHSGDGGVARDKADALLARIHASADDGGFDACDLLVEVLLPPGSRDESAHARPDDIVGIHLAPYAEQMTLLEIAAGARTSRQALAHAFDLAARLRKTPIALHGGVGFYSDRVLTAYVDEGMCLLDEGTTPELIESAAALVGMALGPLASADEMPLETHWNIVRRAMEDGEGRAPRSVAAYHVSRQMAQHFIRFGRHVGAGFYTYPQDGKKFLWPGLKDVFKHKPYQPDSEAIGQRLLTIQALEAARCVEEGMLHHAADADVGAVSGWGFPSYTGGPLSWIDTLSIAAFVTECESMAQRYGPRFQPSPWLMARAARNESFYGNAGTAGV